MTPNFFKLSVDANVLAAPFVGATSYVFDVPPDGRSVGSGTQRRVPFFFSITKGSAINPATDYVRLERSPDGGTTWYGVLAEYDATAAANFLAGQSGQTSVAFTVPVELWAGEKVRMTASSGLTLVKNGFLF